MFVLYIKVRCKYKPNISDFRSKYFILELLAIIQHQRIWFPLGWIIWMEPDRPSHHAIWKPVRLHLGDPVHEVTVYISSHTEI